MQTKRWKILPIAVYEYERGGSEGLILIVPNTRDLFIPFIVDLQCGLAKLSPKDTPIKALRAAIDFLPIDLV